MPLLRRITFLNIATVAFITAAASWLIYYLSGYLDRVSGTATCVYFAAMFAHESRLQLDRRCPRDSRGLFGGLAIYFAVMTLVALFG